MTTGEWIELTLTQEQTARVTAAAAREGMSVEEWATRAVLSALRSHENLGARWPKTVS